MVSSLGIIIDNVFLMAMNKFHRIRLRSWNRITRAGEASRSREPVEKSLVRLTMGILWLAVAGVASAVEAHEFWIDLARGTLMPGQAIKADLKVGRMLSGVTHPYLSSRFRRFHLGLGDASDPVQGVEGDLPALARPPLGRGLHVIATKPSPSAWSTRTGRFFAPISRRKVTITWSNDTGNVACRRPVSPNATRDTPRRWSRSARSIPTTRTGRSACRWS